MWAARITAQSDWLAEGKCRPDDKRDGKWTWSGFDMMSANAPIDQQHRHPSHNPGRWGWSRQAAEGHRSLSQHCPIPLHITPCETPLAFFTWWTDDNHPRSIVSLGLLISGIHVFSAIFAPIYNLQSVKLYCWWKCQDITLSVLKLSQT